LADTFEARRQDKTSQQLVENLRMLVAAHIRSPYIPAQYEVQRAFQNPTTAGIAYQSKNGLARVVDRTAQQLLSLHGLKPSDLSGHLDTLARPHIVDHGAGKSNFLSVITKGMKKPCQRTAVELHEKYSKWQSDMGNETMFSLAGVHTNSVSIFHEGWGPLFWPSDPFDVEQTPKEVKRVLAVGGYALISGVAGVSYLQWCEDLLAQRGLSKSSHLSLPRSRQGAGNLYTYHLQMLSVGALVLDENYSVTAQRVHGMSRSGNMEPQHQLPNALWLQRVR
jgi:hypothetical protein